MRRRKDTTIPATIAQALRQPRDACFVRQLEAEFNELADGERDTCKFPSMNSYYRFLIHEMAQLYQLKSESVGMGDDRYTTVSRTSRTARPAFSLSAQPSKPTSPSWRRRSAARKSSDHRGPETRRQAADVGSTGSAAQTAPSRSPATHASRVRAPTSPVHTPHTETAAPADESAAEAVTATATGQQVAPSTTGSKQPVPAGVSTIAAPTPASAAAGNGEEEVEEVEASVATAIGTPTPAEASQDAAASSREAGATDSSNDSDSEDEVPVVPDILPRHSHSTSNSNSNVTGVSPRTSGWLGRKKSTPSRSMGVPTQARQRGEQPPAPESGAGAGTGSGSGACSGGRDASSNRAQRATAAPRGVYVPPSMRAARANVPSVPPADGPSRSFARFSRASTAPPDTSSGASRDARRRDHLVEVVDIPQGIQRQHIIDLFVSKGKFSPADFDVQVVDRSTMLVSFSGCTAAQRAMTTVTHPVIRLRPLSFSVAAAMRSLPAPVKARRDTSVARRLIGRALGTRLPRTRTGERGSPSRNSAGGSSSSTSSRRPRGRGAQSRGRNSSTGGGSGSGSGGFRSDDAAGDAWD